MPLDEMHWSRRRFLAASSATAFATAAPCRAATPAGAKGLHEDWSSGRIDPARWYMPRRKWGNGNRGVIPENVSIGRDTVRGVEQNVLICHGQGDRYAGDRIGWEGKGDRVGGMVVSKDHFASGRFAVDFKIGTLEKTPDGPADPHRPIGMVPSFWTYGYRWVDAAPDKTFHRAAPLYNPHMDVKGWDGVEYWSEIDFPEFGKEQNFDKGLFNTFLNVNHNSKVFDTARVIDGRYHRAEMIWRTTLIPIDVTDQQVVEHDSLYWIQDRAIPFEQYRGNPLRKTAEGYAVCAGKEIAYALDGERAGHSTHFVPAMAAQLTLGVWFPDWGGAAPWARSSMSIASVSIEPLNDPGDVFGVLTESLPNNFDVAGKPVRATPDA